MLHIWDIRGFSLSRHLVVPSGRGKPPAGTVAWAVLLQLLPLASFSWPVASLSVREEEGADRKQVYLKLLVPVTFCSCVLVLLSGVGQEKQADPLRLAGLSLQAAVLGLRLSLRAAPSWAQDKGGLKFI
ncbi:hypothetical protein AAFF_G00296030 [Aldrovandia affinis]|uniref:Uncharacterized protein n=1 Tax=Aldrovandia affinis TaxID=143900 RepID=A0AAD7SR84_9TELE|nr:hypothetical protein AAFF_G00296030 [Aldrovandia affinis]